MAGNYGTIALAVHGFGPQQLMARSVPAGMVLQPVSLQNSIGMQSGRQERYHDRRQLTDPIAVPPGWRNWQTQRT